MLRLYEWERTKRFPWQIDFWLPAGSEFLFSRVCIVNPHDETIPMYWWTNMAVPETEHTRVLAPAETAIVHGPEVGLDSQNLGVNLEMSYPARMTRAWELFFRVERDHRPFVSALDGSGRGLVQTSTERLIGRKAFYWGRNAGGRKWQEILGGRGHAYLEVQAGLARTQLESVPMPPRSEWSWTEAFGPMDCAEAITRKQWNDAWPHVEKALVERLPVDRLVQADRALAGVAGHQPDAVLVCGSGWGALERRRLAAEGHSGGIPAQLIFGEETLGEEQVPWLALLESGALPERRPKDGPGAFMVQPDWRRLLEQALSAGRGDHWLSWFHLGNMRCEEFDLAGASEAWQRSIECRSNSWAFRNLALLSVREKNMKEARRLLEEGLAAGPRPVALALELGQTLLDAADWQALKKFVDSLSAETRAHERIRLLVARAAIEAEDYPAAENILTGEFALVREGETILSDLWFLLQEHRVACEEGAVINDEFRRNIRKRFPPPRNLDFRMGSGT